MTTNMKMEWSKPYHGVQHAGEFGKRSVTVVDYNSFCVLFCYYQGCGFNPIETWHSSTEKARECGEKFLKEGT